VSGASDPYADRLQALTDEELVAHVCSLWQLRRPMASTDERWALERQLGKCDFEASRRERHWLYLDGYQRYLESVREAEEQAQQAQKSLFGKEQPKE
jgi:hypothetical protein